MTRIAVILAFALLGCAAHAQSLPPADLVVVSHAVQAEDLAQTITGRCGDKDVAVSRGLTTEWLEVRYGDAIVHYDASEPFARDVLRQQQTGYFTFLCRPAGGIELHVTAVDLRSPDTFTYSVTALSDQARVVDYSGLMSAEREEVAGYLPAPVSQ